MDVNKLLVCLAWAKLELAAPAEAAQLAAQAVRRLRADTLRRALAGALRVQAMVALRQGQWAAAEQCLEEGLALARAMSYPYGEGRLLEVYGRLHRDRGEPAPARERLAEALSVFRRLGARKDIELTEQLLTTIS